ncbi:MAG: PH domain-containing protein [Planctomycetota bacterium]|jgi:membrane protein YdbS with pleckstrin-like domain
MRRSADRVPALLYARLWRMLVEWFRVPDEPPAPPARPGEPVEVFRPSPAYLRYRKFQFWLLLTLVDVPLLALWIWTFVVIWWLGLLLAPVFVIAIVVPDIVAYVAIHLHYDTMWYAMSARSLRIRHGIWVIREMTITFENVQNVNLRQGPLERCFGIARVMVQTAGGGSGQGHGGETGGHRGLIEGVDNAPQIRDLIMDCVRQGGSAGPGAEPWRAPPPGSWTWTPPHLEALRALRDRLLVLPEGTIGHAG